MKKGIALICPDRDHLLNLALVLAIFIGVGCDSPLPREAWSPGETHISADLPGHPLIQDPSGLFLVDVTIESQGSYRLLLDTGAYGLILADDVADALDTPSLSGVRVQAKTASDQMLPPQRVVQIRELELGAHRFRSLHAFIQKRSAVVLPTEMAHDGILGIGIFRDGLLILDIPRRELRILDGTLHAQSPFVSSTLKGPQEVPYIDLHVQPVGGPTYRCAALIDTGTNALELPALAEHWPIPRTYVRDANVMEIGGRSRQTPRYRLQAQLTLGSSDVHVADPVIGFQGQTGRISTPILQQFILIFDQRHGRLALVPEKHRHQIPSLIVLNSG